MQFKLKRIILFAKDVRALAKFYRDTLGLEIIGDADNKSWIELNAGPLSIGIHSGKHDAAKRAPKIVFYCDDIEAGRALLVERGAKMGKVKASDDLAFCNGKDPEGNHFQISNR